MGYGAIATAARNLTRCRDFAPFGDLLVTRNQSTRSMRIAQSIKSMKFNELNGGR